MISIEYVPLHSLAPHPGNPKEHDIDNIAMSIQRFGYRIPLDTNAESTSSPMVAGHGRREALLKLQTLHQEGKAEVPDGIQVSPEGVWMVPILRGTKPLDPAEAEAFILADNQIQMNGPMNKEKLKNMMQRVSATVKGLQGTGFLKKAAEQAKAMGAPGDELESPPEGKERALPPTPLATGLKPLVMMFGNDIYLKVTSCIEIIQREENLFTPKDVLVFLLNRYMKSKGYEEVL